MFSLSTKSYKLWIYITFIIGFSLSIFAAWFTYYHYNEKEKLRFELASNEIITLIKTRMHAYEQVLKSGVALFSATNSINKNEWAIFVKEHKLDENFKGIQGFGYSEAVYLKNLKNHEKKMQEEGYLNYYVRPKGEREFYAPVILLEPYNEKNKKVIGFDVFSEKVRRAAIQKAMESGEAVITGKVTLVQEEAHDIQAGFLMYLAVYEKNSKLDTNEDRVKAIKGFVSAPFRINDLMDGILRDVFPYIDFEIYDGKTTNKKNLLYDSNTVHTNKIMYKTLEVSINNHTWTLLFRTDNILNSENSYIIFLVPILLLILTFLLMLLLFSLIKTNEKAIDLAKKATDKLAVSEERFRFALEGAGDGVWDWNMKTNEVYFSKKWKEMLGFSEDEISNTLENWEKRVHPDDLKKVYEDINDHINGKTEAYSNEHRLRCKDNSYKWILDSGVIVEKDINGTPIRMVGSHSDISKRKENERKLNEYIQIINKNVVTSTTDLNGVITNVSDAFCEMTAYSKDELIGKTHNILRDKETPKELYEELWNTIKAKKIWKGEIKNRNKNGEYFWTEITISPIKNHQDIVTGYTAIHHNVTNKKIAEKLSITDKLTQLYNRLKLDEIFSMKLAVAQRYNTPFSVIMIDIDHFKEVNDIWGHQAGDDVLKEFSTILKEHARETDIIGRWGGEEFLIILQDTDINGAIKLAEKLRKLIFEYTFPFVGHKTASFGVSTYHAGDDEKNIIKRADNALYEAKKAGRNLVFSEKYF